jgi:hypothetical protein
VDEYFHETRHLKISGSALDLKMSYAREKSFIGLFVLALFALKPIFIAWKSPNPYLHLVAVLILVLSIYAGLALTFDRTIIHAAGGRLRLRHGPLPLFRGTEVACYDIKSFRCEERRARAAHYYAIEAELLDGRRVKILSPVPDAGDAQHAFTALRRWREAAAGLKNPN